MQVKLLRFLQEGTFMPVGGRQEKKADVRVVAATHRDLEAMVREAPAQYLWIHRRFKRQPDGRGELYR